MNFFAGTKERYGWQKGWSFCHEAVLICPEYLILTEINANSPGLSGVI